MSRIFAISALIFVCLQTAAQNDPGYDTFKEYPISTGAGSDNAELCRIYSAHTGVSYALINGREYFPYYYRSSFSPILYSGRKHSGSVTIDGVVYQGVDLDYDTFTDNVVLIDSSRFLTVRPLRVALNKNNIESFSLCFGADTLRFRFFSSRTDSLFYLPDGFYEEVKGSSCRYLIKHRSDIQNRTGVDEYFYAPYQYIDIGSGFTRITGTRQFVNLFGNKSEEIRKFMKDTGVRKIRKAGKAQVINILRQYDKLKGTF